MTTMKPSAFAASVWWTKQRWPWAYFVVLTVLALEALWLLPALGARTDAIRAGAAVPASSLHTIFIALELLQCAALVHIAVVVSRSPARDE